MRRAGVQLVHSGTLVVDWALRIDTLTVVMLVVVNTVSSLVHIYSIGYMAHDPHRPRFFAYLSLFTFAMLMLVTADNLVQMFFGWEGVGLASYLLIGFWYHRPSANAAAIKAFVVNRVGDFGFALGIFGVFVLFDSVELETIFANARRSPGTTIALPVVRTPDALTVVCLLLFMGAMGKSAQFLLHTWLPDAMEGPTPVSALIHAATMVTAGVFMVARLSPLFELAPVALGVVIFFGATTAFFAATVGLVQNDIKRVIAYSTCSQLGYMFVGIGVGAYPTGIFHLFTHAFFKALLFLGAGSVIHAVADEQDMRKMGGLRTHIPLTYWMMIIGTLALTGFPFTAGYFSKDAIIEARLCRRRPDRALRLPAHVVAALMTSFYSWRLIFMTFHGAPRAPAEVMKHIHESPAVMIVPLILLAIGALFAGLVFSGAFIGEENAEFWRSSLVHRPHPRGDAPRLLLGDAGANGDDGHRRGAGDLLLPHASGVPAQIARRHHVLYASSSTSGTSTRSTTSSSSARDVARPLPVEEGRRLADRRLRSRRRLRLGHRRDPRVVRLQTGYLYHYAFAMLIGVAALDHLGPVRWVRQRR